MVFSQLPQMRMVRYETALEDCWRRAREESRVCRELGVLQKSEYSVPSGFSHGQGGDDVQ